MQDFTHENEYYLNGKIFTQEEIIKISNFMFYLDDSVLKEIKFNNEIIIINKFLENVVFIKENINNIIYIHNLSDEYFINKSEIIIQRFNNNSFIKIKNIFDNIPLKNIKEIIFNNDFVIKENFENEIEYIRKNYNDIIYIENEKFKFYLSNGELHNLNDASYIINNFFKDYYINGNKFSYENWLEHPEVKRNLRNKKLFLI